MFMKKETKKLHEHSNKIQSSGLVHSAVFFLLVMHLKISPLLETLRALVECEDLSSSTKREARDFGLTRVLQLKDTVRIHYHDDMARTMAFFENHWGWADMWGEPFSFTNWTNFFSLKHFVHMCVLFWFWVIYFREVQCKLDNYECWTFHYIVGVLLYMPK